MFLLNPVDGKELFHLPWSFWPQFCERIVYGEELTLPKKGAGLGHWPLEGDL